MKPEKKNPEIPGMGEHTQKTEFFGIFKKKLIRSGKTDLSSQSKENEPKLLKVAI